MHKSKRGEKFGAEIDKHSKFSPSSGTKNKSGKRYGITVAAVLILFAIIGFVSNKGNVTTDNPEPYIKSKNTSQTNADTQKNTESKIKINNSSKCDDKTSSNLAASENKSTAIDSFSSSKTDTSSQISSVQTPCVSSSEPSIPQSADSTESYFIALNTTSMKYHTQCCSAEKRLDGDNRLEYSVSVPYGTEKDIQYIESQGYALCKLCKNNDYGPVIH